MATSAGTSNLKKPWAWLAAIAVFLLAIASSTALYVVNPAVKMQLPWWAAVAAPALVYGIVLPLGVPRIRMGGWVAGFFTLAVLHVSIALATAWIYSRVGFIPFDQALATALWGFPPALVLAMVGSLVMLLPFLKALAPRPAAPRPQPGATPLRPGAAKQPWQAPEVPPSRDRQAWARVSTGAEQESAAASAVAQAVSVMPAMAAAAAPTEPPPALAVPPPALAVPPIAVRDEPAVHAAPLSGVNGAAPDTADTDAPAVGGDDLPPADVPDFRQALSELFGEPAAAPAVEETREAPEELIALEPSFTAAIAADEPATPAEPVGIETSGISGPVVRIPFDRVVGQLPPGAFRVPLGQVGARLQEAETLVVPLDVVVPQLGEGVVQVPWEVVAEQFPASVFAVAPAEVKERIVNGRLLLPLDEIIRQLPPDVFAASIGRGPVEVPGIEGFPAPFKPPGWEEKPAAVVPPRGEPVPLSPELLSPELLSIEVPDAADIARDLALTPPEPEVLLAEIEPVPPPSEPELAAASLLQEALPVEAEEVPQNVLEIEEVVEILDLDSLLEGTKAQQTLEAGRESGTAVEETREAPEELIALEPSFTAAITADEPATPAEPVEPVGSGISGPVVRIPFDRVVGQLPPGAFRVPLGQVGARLQEAETLVVPLDVVVPQLGEGVVQVPWEVVAEQFPASVFAVAPAEMKERIADGRLLLPLDEIIRQLPPDVFAASIGRGPVEVPGIEGFPAPFKPLELQAPPPTPAAAEPVMSAPPPAPPVLPEVERAPEPVPVVSVPVVSAPVIPEPAMPLPVAPVPTAPVEIEQPEPQGNAEKLAALMAPWETAAFDEVQVGEFAIISVSAAGLAGNVVVAAAGRLSPVIARRAPRPVEQATLRGIGGTLVLTPVGSGWNTGTALAVGLRAGGPLARLEILARRAAAAHVPASPAEGRQTVPITTRFDAAPPPPAAATAAEDLQAFGPLTAHSYREPASGALIHCFVPPGASAALLAPFAWELAQAMGQGSQAGPLGSFHSAVLRSGRERLEIRRLSSAAGPAPVLVVQGVDTGRPGLARLQVERAAARLGAS